MIEDQKQLAAKARETFSIVSAQLLSERNGNGHWQGCLSRSALSTATAVTALAVFLKHRSEQQSAIRNPQFAIDSGLQWLADNINPDGGWGDTNKSVSNVSTTALCWAAFGAVAGADEKYNPVVRAAGCWLEKQCGSLTPPALSAAIAGRYGKDRTFSAPILTMCALAGRLGQRGAAWRHVIQLPFELAAFPRSWFAALKMPVVSYALPALIAIGQARHFHCATQNPFARVVRNSVRKRTLRVLSEIQPSNGGFLEAVPLTSFVAMSLASSGEVAHQVTRRAVEFLLGSQRDDGSWAIDTNLATWLTTLSINALNENANFNVTESTLLRDWLLKQQFFIRHLYTDAAPGGWAWTDLPGGVPDADDTAGALLALNQLGLSSAQIEEAVEPGVAWLLDLQNTDGGIPTFCRGWGTLPFDRSAPDLTAHAIRAWLAWFGEVAPQLQGRIDSGLKRALKFLLQTQRADGAWVPLWFGNQFAKDEENPVYGTSRVLLALLELREFISPNFHSRRVSFSTQRHLNLAATVDQLLQHGIAWIVACQNEDGSWSGEKSKPPSVEETALAVEALAVAYENCEFLRQQIRSALMRGASWLIERVNSGEWKEPSPIGYYFAKLWYYEKLYPQIFTAAALNRAAQAFQGGGMA